MSEISTNFANLATQYNLPRSITYLIMFGERDSHYLKSLLTVGVKFASNLYTDIEIWKWYGF